MAIANLSAEALQWAKEPAFPHRRPLESKMALDQRGQPSEEIHEGINKLTYVACTLFPTILANKLPADTLADVARKTRQATTALLEELYDASKE